MFYVRIYMTKHHSLHSITYLGPILTTGAIVTSQYGVRYFKFHKASSSIDQIV